MNRYFAIVPAAGSGSRMGAERPKQYLPLAGQPLIFHALATLCAVQAIDSVTVVISAEDEWWGLHDWSRFDGRLHVLRVGGATRAETVRNALQALSAGLDEDDWVLVHDAARACLTTSHVESLIATLSGDPVGGLLAQPVADTLKRGDPSGRVLQTVSRESMWQAQTPQMFRAGLLGKALIDITGVTDEAGAIEACGLSPRLVAADATNFKVTFPQDLALAELILQSRSV